MAMSHHNNIMNNTPLSNTPDEAMAMPARKAFDGKMLGLGLLSVVSLAFIATSGWMYKQNLDVQAANKQLTQQYQDSESGTVPTLPTDAVRLSGCVPGEGEHWGSPKDLPNGPLFAVFNNRIISTEYMWAPDQIPGSDTSKMTKDQFTNYLATNKLNFADFLHNRSQHINLHKYRFESFATFYSAPHTGMTVPHLDMHMYFVSTDYTKGICPNNTIADASSPEIVKTALEHGIPVPGHPLPKVASSSATPMASMSGTLSH
jgi:hypothetical protein